MVWEKISEIILGILTIFLVSLIPPYCGVWPCLGIFIILIFIAIRKIIIDDNLARVHSIATKSESPNYVPSEKDIAHIFKMLPRIKPGEHYSERYIEAYSSLLNIYQKGGLTREQVGLLQDDEVAFSVIKIMLENKDYEKRKKAFDLLMQSFHLQLLTEYQKRYILQNKSFIMEKHNDVLNDNRVHEDKGHRHEDNKFVDGAHFDRGWSDHFDEDYGHCDHKDTGIGENLPPKFLH